MKFCKNLSVAVASQCNELIENLWQQKHGADWLTTCHKLGRIAFVALTCLSPAPTYATALADAVKGEIGRNPVEIEQRCSALLQSARKAKHDVVGHRLAGMPLFSAYDRLVGLIDLARYQSDLTVQVHPSSAVRRAAAACATRAQTAKIQIEADPRIGRALASLVDVKLPNAVHYIVVRQLSAIRRTGAMLPRNKRTEIADAQLAIKRLEDKFDTNIRTSTLNVTVSPAALAGLSPEFISSLPTGANETRIVSTDYAQFIPFMTYSQDAEARRELLNAFNRRAWPANMAVLTDLLVRREALAKALGNNSFADLVTADTIAGSAAGAESFIAQYDLATTTASRTSLRILLDRYRRDRPDALCVPAWEEKRLVSVLERELEAGAASDQLAFQFPAALEMMLKTFEQMFPVRIRRSTAASWDPLVTRYEIFEAGRLIGRFSLDLAPRTDKVKTAAWFPLAHGWSGQSVPAGVIVANLPGARRGAFSVAHRDIRLLFHEFGHLFDAIFSGQGRWALNGYAYRERDVGEIPAKVMENLSWQSPVITRLAGRSDEAAVATQLNRMRTAYALSNMLNSRMDLGLSAAALRLHQTSHAWTDPTVTFVKAYNNYAAFPLSQGDKSVASFEHLSGYSALYYSYILADMIAAELTFATEGVDRKSWQQFRTQFLQKGASISARAQLKSFLGRDFTAAAFERSAERDAALLARLNSVPNIAKLAAAAPTAACAGATGE